MGFNSGFKGLNRRRRQFSRLLAAEVCASAVVMLDTPCSKVVWMVLATHSIRQFPLHFPYRASPCAITFQLDSTSSTVSQLLSLNYIFFLSSLVWPLPPTNCRCRLLLIHLITPRHTTLGMTLWTSDRPVSEASTWQYTTFTTEDIHNPGGIRTCHPNKRAAADLRLRPRGH